MKIKPVEGRLVRDPATMLPLAPDGAEVPDYDPHWHEALRWGDVELVGTGTTDAVRRDADPAVPLAAAVAQAESAVDEPVPVSRAADLELMETSHVG